MKYSRIGWAKLAAAVAVTLITAGVPAALQAQSTGLKVVVPFEFQVGDRVLPPGTYMVWLRGNGSAITVSDGSGHSALSLTNAIYSPAGRNVKDPLLFFNVYGDRHFLSGVRWPGYTEARSLLKSKSEIRIAREMSAPRAPTAILAAK